ncbi:hypothetical protein ACFQY7_42275 [Actinomadura luteofluorescens]|uniref:hypothetical protein n=1 Tax=Actinomadura luteofluorescens TaxID=46163 RepID=UPI0036350EA7
MRLQAGQGGAELVDPCGLRRHQVRGGQPPHAVEAALAQRVDGPPVLRLVGDREKAANPSRDQFEAVQPPVVAGVLLVETAGPEMAPVLSLLPGVTVDEYAAQLDRGLGGEHRTVLGDPRVREGGERFVVVVVVVPQRPLRGEAAAITAAP